MIEATNHFTNGATSEWLMEPLDDSLASRDTYWNKLYCF